MAASTQTGAVKLVRLPSGLQLECVERGPRGGLPVLLLHSSTDTWRSFKSVLPHLPSRWNVFARSQRGHGSSQAIREDRTRGCAGDAAELIESLGRAPAVEGGQVMGATNAKRMALVRPARALVAAGAFVSFADKAGLMKFVRNDTLTREATVPRPLPQALQRDCVATPHSSTASTVCPELLLGRSVSAVETVVFAAVAALFVLGSVVPVVGALL